MHVLGIGIVDTEAVVIACVLASIGLMLLAGGWLGLLPTRSSLQSETTKGVAETTVRLGLAGIGFVAGLLLTGWPVFAFYSAAFGAFVPTLRNAKRERRDAIDRVEAIATWVETIRDNISGAAGLTQALRNSANNAPEPIRVEVRDLVLRLQHEAVVPSLRRFAADVKHPTADMAIGCLILASTRSAGSLAGILANTAHAARDSASMMRHIEAGRVQSQSQAKLVAVLSAIVSGLMILNGGEFLDPYDSLGGQIAMLLIGGTGAGATVAMYRLAKPAPVERVFAGVERAVSPVANRTSQEV